MKLKLGRIKFELGQGSTVLVSAIELMDCCRWTELHGMWSFSYDALPGLDQHDVDHQCQANRYLSCICHPPFAPLQSQGARRQWQLGLGWSSVAISPFMPAESNGAHNALIVVVFQLLISVEHAGIAPSRKCKLVESVG